MPAEFLSNTPQIFKISLSFKDVYMISLRFFTAALALRSRGLVIGSREKVEREREREEKEEEKNLQIAIRCLWDLFD